jgi:hypothetical protein
LFHLLTYTYTQAAASNLATMSMVADGAIAQGTTGYRFTEPYRVLAVYGGAAAMTQLEWSSPQLNAMSKWNVWPVNLSANVPANPNIDDYRAFAPELPMMEDISMLVSDSAAGAETMQAHVWIGTKNWSPSLGIVQGMYGANDPLIGRRMKIKFTSTPTKVANSWSADAAIAFEQLPRGGVYCVVGGIVQAAACTAWRINFPRQPLYQGRKLFPGDICQQAYGDVPNWRMDPWLGPWGVFHTWEPPFFDIYGLAAGAVTATGVLDCVYLGGAINPDHVLQQALAVLGNAA